MKKFMFYYAFVASLGGFLFGFDTVVISGAEKAIQSVYQLSNFLHGFTVAIALIGTIIGALICGIPAEKYGRKKSLQVIALLYFISALGSAIIINWPSFLFFRLLGGIAIGASSVIGPMYIAELSPSNWRGRFVAFFQFNIVLGLVVAYISNYLISGAPDDWRWMLGVLAFPAFIFSIFLLTSPESPRWLIKVGRIPEAKKVFEKVGAENIASEMNSISESLKSSNVHNERLFQMKYFKPIMLAFLIATFNQLSGINAILYYAPRIFEMSGVLKESALMQSIFIGLTNLVFTMLAMIIIDKVGRRRLLIIGSFGMVISLSLVSRGYYLKSFEGYSMLIYLVGFIGSFAMSLGAVIWVLISEVFPNSVRGKGQAFGSSIHWIWSAVLSWVFPVIVGSEYNGGMYIFGFFAFVVFINIFFAWKVLPETKNKSLEQIQGELVKESAVS
jgi:sugar porter (SP) family MFS transporter